MREVVWTELATQDYQGQIDYLLGERSEKAAVGFIERVEDVLYLLRQSPEMFPLSGIKGSRKAIVNKWVSLYYGITAEGEKVTLYRFWHNSQDPSRMELG